MSTSSKLSSQPSQPSQAFVPSPQWLTESPAHQTSSGASNSPWRRMQRNAPGQFDGLWSPIPPPPANLYPGSPDAFNVDPGVPFLATAGSSDVPDSEEGSESESSSRKKFVGGFVTGIRDTVRRSLRRPRRDTLREPTSYFEQQELRDSGYGSSPVTAPTPSPIRHPSSTEAQTSHEQGARQAVPTRHYTAPYYTTYPTFTVHNDYRNDFDAVAELQGRMSMFSGTVTAETASIKPGSDYRKMETPLDTEDSLSAYIKRTKQFIYQISALPFSSKTRVTYDHFPERSLRDDPRRRPFVEWHRPGYGPTNYSPADDSKLAVSPHEIPQQNTLLYTPHRVPAVELDLREEFNDIAAIPSLATTNPASIQPQPVQVDSGPLINFQSVATRQAHRRETLNSAPADHSRDESFNPVTRQSARKRRMTTPFHHGVPIDAEATQDQWQQYPHYRDGYVPPELAERHYGSRYGQGVHSARADLVSVGSGPSSATSRRPYQS